MPRSREMSEVSSACHIYPTACICEGARLGADVQVGPYTLIHPNVEIGDGCVIGGWCEIGVPTPRGDGQPLCIGTGAVVRSHSVIYESSAIGPGLTTGHHVCIRELTTAGAGLQLGSYGDIQGHCIIGDYLRTHNGVHIGQFSKIGNYVWMFPDVLLTNDPTPPSEHLLGPIVEDFVVLCAKSTLLPGVRVGEGAVIGAHALVGMDIPPGMLANGSPAKIVCKASALRMKSDPGVRAYPWQNRFHRGYPDNVIEFLEKYSSDGARW